MSRAYADIFDLATELRSAPSIMELNASFQKLVESLGPYAYAMGEVHKTRIADRRLTISTYPRYWVEQYLEQKYEQVDPTINPAYFWRTPYDWRALDKTRTRAQRQLFAEFSDLGFKGGYSIPLPASPSTLLLIGIASREREMSASAQAALVLAFSQYHHRYHEIASPHPSGTVPSLTARERECLLWVAQGKDTNDVGIILNISENTVKFHLKNAMGKLDCHSRIQAVVRAMCLGLIHP